MVKGISSLINVMGMKINDNATNGYSGVQPTQCKQGWTQYEVGPSNANDMDTIVKLGLIEPLGIMQNMILCFLTLILKTYIP
jgi:hypothetical protein